MKLTGLLIVVENGPTKLQEPFSHFSRDLPVGQAVGKRGAPNGSSHMAFSVPGTPYKRPVRRLALGQRYVDPGAPGGSGVCSARIPPGSKRG
jgi:hypothetical protein